MTPRLPSLGIDVLPRAPARRTIARTRVRTGRARVSSLLSVTLAALHTGVCFADIDTRDQNYTCIIPVGADQPIGESLVWKSIVHGTKEELNGKVQRADEVVNERLEKRQEREVMEGELGEDPEAPVEDPVERKEGRPIEAEVSVLLQLADRHATATCAKTSTVTSAMSKGLGAATDTLTSEELRERVKDGVKEALDTPLAKNLEHAAKQRQLSELQDYSCEAGAGFYCLSSILSDQRKYLTPYEFCVLSRSISPCPAGFYCQGGDVQPKACSPGHSCPVGSVQPEDCGWGHYCPLAILRYKCLPGYQCHPTSDRPEPCNAGSYCPDGVRLTCPEGFFCPPGNTQPHTCPWFASCPRGSTLPDMQTPASWILLASTALWAGAVRAVPSWFHQHGSFRGALPVTAVVALLGTGWAARLELLSPLLGLLSPQVLAAMDPRTGLFGGTLHSTGLVFLTLTYLFLLHGLLISPRIKHPKFRFAADLAMCLTICLAFSAYLRDWAAFLFMTNLWVALKVVWMLITQQGPLALRVGLLGAGLLLLVICSLQLGSAVLAHMLGWALLGSAAKELLRIFLPRLHMALAMWKVRSADSVLNDSSFRPLMHSLVAESPRTENPEAHPSTAARVAASAHASLAEARATASAPSVRDMNPAAWAALRTYFCGACDEEEDGVIDIGDTVDGPNGISFDLRDVSYCLDDHKKLLHSISFTVPAGAKVAVMGASGSGKTTLLSVLSGRCGDGCFAGKLYLDNMPFTPGQMSELRPLIGYVPQDDIMHQLLTVRENIMFQAGLRLPCDGSPGISGTQGSKAQELVESTISGLGLGHVAGRLINDGLSGGQRKRVSVGMEVVTQPRILLLDEPSSGLDSTTAHRTIKMVLQGPCTDACTTFATIHQPRWSTLGLFDMLVLLAPGGHLVFAGPMAAAKAYFTEILHVDFPANENPADIIVDASTFESARKMATSGIWKNPPQCLRAVLFPTPQVVNEEYKSHWQQDEYGRLLAALWRNFASVTKEAAMGPAREEVKEDVEQPACRPVAARGKTMLQPLEVEDTWAIGLSRPAASGQRKESEGASVLTEARARVQVMRWESHIWLQISRTLLVNSRAIPTVVFLQLLMILTTSALAFAFGNLLGQNIFMPYSLLHLVVGILQSVAAQRLFGGLEKEVASREGAVCSSWHSLFGFLGKDIASIPEMIFSALCFALTYWPISGTLLSGTDHLAIGFASIYCYWGLNHIWAIICPRHIGMLLAVLVPFLSFLSAGVEPDVQTLAPLLGGLGSIIILASPIRWTNMMFATQHVLGAGSGYLDHAFKGEVQGHFLKRKFDLDEVRCPETSMNILDRWVSGRGHVCHTGQLFLLGFLFRLFAVCCFLIRNSSRASGGLLPLGLVSHARSRMLRDAIVVFLVFFLLFEILLIGHTY